MIKFSYFRFLPLVTFAALVACTSDAFLPTPPPHQAPVSQASLTSLPTQTAVVGETPMPMTLSPTIPMPASTRTAENEATSLSLTPPHPTATRDNGLPSPQVTTASPEVSPQTTWKTFVSTHLQVAIDYPPDWSVNEQATGATFTSPQGDIIQLLLIDTGSLAPEDYFNENQLPNTRCSSSPNAYGITVRNCFDTLSHSQTADFLLKSATGPSQLLSLTTRMRGDLEVFQAMIDSVRPAPP